MGAFLGSVLWAKKLIFIFAPVLATGFFIRPSDFVYSIAIAVLLTFMVMTLFINNFVNFESRFVQYFSHLTASPRWFTVWLLVMVLWIPVRHLLIENGWLSTDNDFIVATILWSCVPYMVENLLKATSAKQMAILMKILEKLSEAVEAIRQLVIEIKAAQDRSEERDRATDKLIVKLLEAISIE